MKVVDVVSQKHRIVLFYPLLIVIGVYLWHGMTGFSLRDEGFLWYGAKALLMGDFPFRDFDGYDPGRYILVAGTMRILGDSGIVSMRMAAMMCQLVAIIVLMLHIVRAGMIRRAHDELIVVGLLCLISLWMFPRHKIFDISTSLVLVALFSWFISSVTVRKAFLVGLGVGLVAIMGRNHGVYSLVSIGLVLPVVLFHNFSYVNTLRIIGAGFVGVLIGFSPIFLFELLKPGFMDGLIYMLSFLAETKTTNVALPVPWPWLITFDDALIQIVRRFSIGFWFVALLVGGWALYIYAVFVWVRRKQTPSLLLASSALAVVYTHVAFSRADPAHLAQSIAPFLVALFCIGLSLSKRKQVGAIAATLLLSLTAIGPLHPGVQCALSTKCEPVTIAGSTVIVAKNIADEVQFFVRIHEALNGDGDGGLIVPFWPGAYALLDMRAPVWEIYPLLTRQAEFERAEIARLQARRIRYVIWSDAPLDGNDALRYSKTHPLIAEYIRSSYEDVPELSTQTFRVLKVKATQP
jgi:hypothetical protein